MAYFEGEIPVVTTGYGNNNGFGFGNGWEGLIGLALVAGLFGNGWGGFGTGGNRGGIAENYALATDFATIERKLDGVNNGLCDGFYAQNTNTLNGFAAVQQTLCQGFSGVNATINQGFANTNNAICTLGYQNQAGFNSLGSQLASCCCDLRQQISDCCCTTQRAIDAINYNMAKNTCDIIQSSHNDTDRIISYLTNEKIEGLRAENTALKGQISNDRQSATIINALAPKCAEPAYIVPNPNCCYNYGVYPVNNGCGTIQ